MEEVVVRWLGDLSTAKKASWTGIGDRGVVVAQCFMSVSGSMEAWRELAT